MDPCGWRKRLSAVLLAVAVGFLAVSGQSLWMDEANTVMKALMPGLKEWKTLLMHFGGSDVQMPVYMFMVWCWEKAGAQSEYVLRLVNLPWLVVGALALSRFRWWPIVFLSSPFVWYYAGELRPYAMQIAGGCVSAWSLVLVMEGRSREKQWRGLHAAAGGALLLVASSMSAAVWAAGLWLAVVVLRTDWLARGGFWLRVSPWLLLIGGFGTYYSYTLFEGYRAVTSGGGGLWSMGFGFYELIGMVGLGPGRNDLRVDPLTVTAWLQFVLPAALLVGTVWAKGVLSLCSGASGRMRLAVGLAVGFPLVVFVGIGELMDFRVLGRHLSPLLPAVVLPLAYALDGFVSERPLSRRFWRIMAAGAVTVMFASALSVRFSPRHARDDFRGAAAVALQAFEQGKVVWWRADMNVARYYAYRRGGMSLVQAIQPWESNRPASLLGTDLVIVNRPDLYGFGQDDREELRDNYFELSDTQFHGIEVWAAKSW